MDIMLQRILSLIPKKENGDFERGALKDFAQSIGLKSGNLISDWRNGRSKSYQSYIYQISAKYNVSVEWLRGETDEKKPALKEGGQLPEFELLTPENQEFVRKQIAFLLDQQRGS